MTFEEKKEVIKQHPAFYGLDNDAVAFIAEQARGEIYQPHSLLVQQGDEVKAVYFIYQGLIKIYVINDEGKEIPVRTTGEKYFVGDLGAVDGGPIPATVEALQETHVLILTKETFLLTLNKYPTFAINLLRLWAEKVRNNNTQREITFSLQLKERTLYVLQKLAHHFPNHEITLSQEELAHIIGATRPRVAEVLQELEEQKYIKISNRAIRVL